MGKASHGDYKRKENIWKRKSELEGGRESSRKTKEKAERIRRF